MNNLNLIQLINETKIGSIVRRDLSSEGGHPLEGFRASRFNLNWIENVSALLKKRNDKAKGRGVQQEQIKVSRATVFYT